MIWLILLIGLVMGGSVAIMLWLIPQIGSNNRPVEIYQNGTLYKEFQEELEIDRPKPDSYDK